MNDSSRTLLNYEEKGSLFVDVGISSIIARPPSNNMLALP
jgi:hypothetical protein